MSIFGMGATMKAVNPTEERLGRQKQFIVVVFEVYTLPFFQIALVSCLILWKHFTYFHDVVSRKLWTGIGKLK